MRPSYQRQPSAQSSLDDGTSGTAIEHLLGQASDQDSEATGARLGSKRKGLIDSSEEVFLQGFIDKPATQRIVGVVIIINLFCIGAEADTAFPLANACEVVFVLFYAAELTLRFLTHGYVMFFPGRTTHEGDHDVTVTQVASVLNIFEVWLVLVGMIGVVLLGLGKNNWTAFLLGLRLLRVLRVFRLFPVLTRFVGAISSMAYSLLWIFSVLFLTCYVSAVVLTIYTKNQHLNDAQEYFSSVNTSLFSLFRVTTMDSWHDIANPLVDTQPMWQLFFVCFIAFSAWTMISLLTGVVADTVMQATQDRKKEERHLMENRRMEFVKFLHRAFLHADTDGNGVVDREEFEALIAEDLVTDKMETLGVGMSREELQAAFEMLDVDESGSLTIEEFVHGISQLQQSLSIKHVVAINYALQRSQNVVTSNVKQSTGGIQEALESMNMNIAALSTNIGSLRDEIQLLRTQHQTVSPTRSGSAASLTRSTPPAQSSATPTPGPKQTGQPRRAPQQEVKQEQTSSVSKPINGHQSLAQQSEQDREREKLKEKEKEKRKDSSKEKPDRSKEVGADELTTRPRPGGGSAKS